MTPMEVDANISGDEDNFRSLTRKRLEAEHPDLQEHWLPLINDTDSHGRLFGLTALSTVMDVRDARVRAVEASEKNATFIAQRKRS